MRARQAGNQILAVAEADLRRRARRFAREIAPRLVNKSRQEFVWIWREAVNAFCAEVDQIWQAKIAAMPTGASRGASGVSPSGGGQRRRDSGGRL
jgi:hypothetical protein